MAARHHIQSQRLNLITADVTTSTVARQHARMAELQEQVILPALQRAFDAFAGVDDAVTINKLELELTVPAGKDLASQLAAQLPAALSRALGKPDTRSDNAQRKATFSRAVLSWLRTGNPGWTGGAPTAFADRLATWLAEAPKVEVRRLASLLMTSEAAFIRARTQVQGKVLARVARYLRTLDPALPNTLPATQVELRERCRVAG